ncbi:deoxyguanosinetriphosphate triphosphohydrolase family protein [Desulfatitalea tepidiphila]|uniref:deoxyguanosinetriphosphate triphosphohydrolase family protein n=1 Tax=Desulfatitalea tepidiphila TaxID=1185843 RepID=UPI0006B4FB9C|nr:HD domain-containing protein [Desulfatitalea tepidiphila]
MDRFEKKTLTLSNLKAELNQRETVIYSQSAAFSKDALRRRPEERVQSGYRQSYALDTDRILHSMAYARYIDKTQVFYLIRNDHITHRVLHVQLVSKIARTIGRFLHLNEDLIEAIALGHDIGHTPFGHDGERYLSKLCVDAGIGHFLHNVQSIQFLDCVERKGRGWNLTLQTLDGILCHDGEIHNQVLRPQGEKSFDTLGLEMAKKKADPDFALMPMTLEGCVVRMADTVAYIGRDLEDAIRLQVVQRGDLPVEVTAVLGDSNGTIVYNLVTDIIHCSHTTGHIAFSDRVSNGLKQLKQFNLERIYLNPTIKKNAAAIQTLFELLFESYLNDLQKGNERSKIFTGFLADMSEEYIESHRPAEIVRDFIAGMTDRYFLLQCPERLRPNVIDVS